MRNHTDFETIEYHEDGSRTVKSEITYYPPTTKDKAVAYSILGVLAVAPALPILIPLVAEKVAEKIEARKAAKKQSE